MDVTEHHRNNIWTATGELISLLAKLDKAYLCSPLSLSSRFASLVSSVWLSYSSGAQYTSSLLSSHSPHAAVETLLSWLLERRDDGLKRPYLEPLCCVWEERKIARLRKLKVLNVNMK